MPEPSPSPAGEKSVLVRVAREDEYAAIGDLTVRVYVGEGHTRHDGDYVPELRDVARRAAHTDVLVALDAGGRCVGAVSLALPGSAYAEMSRPDEAEFRMLVVDPAARGYGVGTALVTECLARARAAGCLRMVLCTQREMTTAHRMYERLGFHRATGRDWEPVPGLLLLAYERALQAPVAR